MGCVHSIGHISQGILFKFGTKVYLGIIYKPIDFGDAAFSVPSFIGSKVIYMSFMRSNCHISWRISFKCCMEVCLSTIYTSLVFGDAATCVPSVIGSKVIFWWLSFVRSNCHISWQISFKFSTEMHYTLIYTHKVLVMLLLVLTIVVISTSSFCFREGRGDLCPSFEHKDDTKSLPLPGDTFALRGNTDCDISSFLGIWFGTYFLI